VQETLEDIRLPVPMLRKSRDFTGVTVLMLAIEIGNADRSMRMLKKPAGAQLGTGDGSLPYWKEWLSI
jgi:hypothetical protein